MNVISMEDINYLAQQSPGRINMVLSGMTALMNDTENKVELMESQNWFQRMVKTVTGKNKLTKDEIQQNHDKLNAYMSEAVAELYNLNCISTGVITSLDIQLHELYDEHLQLKQMLGGFICKLNEKIESIDNFHLLVEEISQGIYDHQYPIVTVVYVLSMMDRRMITNERKCAIIIKALRNKNILNNVSFSLISCMEQVMSLDENDAGHFYLELMTIKENYFAAMLLALMDKIYFIDLKRQKFVHKKRSIRNLLKVEDYDENSTLSTEDIFDEFLTAKKDVIRGLSPLSTVQSDRNLPEFFENHKSITDDGSEHDTPYGILDWNMDLLMEDTFKGADKESEVLPEKGEAQPAREKVNINDWWDKHLENAHKKSVR